MRYLVLFLIVFSELFFRLWHDNFLSLLRSLSHHWIVLASYLITKVHTRMHIMLLHVLQIITLYRLIRSLMLHVITLIHIRWLLLHSIISWIWLLCLLGRQMLVRMRTCSLLLLMNMHALRLIHRILKVPRLHT